VKAIPPSSSHGGNVDIITDAASPDTGAATAISGTTTGATTYVNVVVSAAVTGQDGHGIFTSSVGGLNTVMSARVSP